MKYSLGDFTDRFINDIEEHNAGNEVVHTFFAKGIDILIVDKYVVINISSGVLLHLRSENYFNKLYETFKVKNPIAKVENVSGTVKISENNEVIREKLVNYFVKYRHQAIIIE